jgi:TatD DNase family protein
MTNGERAADVVGQSSSKLIDTHCHLDWRPFDADRAEVIRRAVDAGVARMVTIGADVASSRRAVALAEEYAAVYASVGVHPNDAGDFGENNLNELRDLAQHPKVVAIGEIGIDHYWKRVAPDAQARAFRMQLELADEVGKPVIVHNRDATEEVLSILSGHYAGHSSPATRGVLHSFSGDIAVAQRAFEFGFLIGFTGPVTFKKADVLREVARAVPLDRFVVETDAPFLTPEPRRGRRNEPAYVRYTAARIATLRGLSMEELAEQTTANAMRLFRWTNINDFNLSH